MWSMSEVKYTVVLWGFNVVREGHQYSGPSSRLVGTVSSLVVTVFLRFLRVTGDRTTSANSECKSTVELLFVSLVFGLSDS